VEGDGHGDSTSVSGPSNRSSETPLTHEPSADPAEALSAAVPQFSASTALDEQENSMLLEGKEVCNKSTLCLHPNAQNCFAQIATPILSKLESATCSRSIGCAYETFMCLTQLLFFHLSVIYT
jgi:hypothetical protein